MERTLKGFQVQGNVYLQVKPKRSSLKLINYAKLAPGFCGPFEILDRISPVAYIIELPTNMKSHNVFHVSLLKRYVHDPNHIIN
jgi:hypothetical protein